MPRIPTPLPTTVSDWFATIRSDRWLDVAWKLLVLAVTLTLIVVLVSAGGAYTIVAFILAYAALRDEIHNVWSDVWNRDFVEVNT